jgi:hypothetical protein
MRKLFAIVQQAQIEAWCWGSCGKGICASIELLDGVAAMPCAQETCPHLGKDDVKPFGTGSFPLLGDDGEYEVWLRKLNPLDGKGEVRR